MPRSPASTAVSDSSPSKPRLVPAQVSRVRPAGGRQHRSTRPGSSRSEVMMADAVLVTVDGGIAVITINRPEARNAVNGDVARGIARASDELDARSDVRAAILTGAGGSFCAGMDLKGFLAGDVPAVAGRGFGGITERPPAKPVIAAVEGYALAGGFELVLACDLVVASEEARFGLPQQAARPGHQPAPDLRQAESRLLAGDYQVAGEHQLEAAGQRVAFDGRDHGLDRRLLGYAAEAASRSDRRVPGQEPFQVHSGAERAARAGQHQHADVAAGVELLDRRGDAACDVAVDRVPRLRAVDRDDRDAVGDLSADRVFCHGGASGSLRLLGLERYRARRP